jgi:ribonuclease HI
MQAEALALLQGLKQAKSNGISDVSIIGDSQSIIKVLVEDSFPADIRLARVISRIRILVKSLWTASFLHVLRENNKEADLEAKRAVPLPAGFLLTEGSEEWDSIP